MLDLRRTKQRLGALLLRHGKIWRASRYWTIEHRRWLAHLSFDDLALDSALGHYRIALAAREAEVAAIEADLSPWAGREPLADPVARLTAYRGIGELTALTLAAEVIDWRRFPTARSFMCFTGLVPSEYSSGQTTRRGHITKSGNAGVRTALVEAAWHYQHAPAVGAGLRRRHQALPPDTISRAWTAQKRLNSRYRHLINHGKPTTVAATAIARELAGFAWAEMTSTP
jgi:transposase